MSNSVYTVEVLGRDLRLNDVVLFNNQLYLVDAYNTVYDTTITLVRVSSIDNSIHFCHRCDRNEVYYRVMVGTPPKLKTTITKTDSDIEYLIDERAY